MTQNRSTAVMQRRVEAHDSLDDFPTPPWAVRALCEHLAPTEMLWDMVAREPAANRGYLARPLGEYFAKVEAADIHDYGVGYPASDYLFGPDPDLVNWTITNPPFRLAEQFIERALRTSVDGVAVIVRAAFLEGQGRYERLFSQHPPTTILQFTERVVMQKGRCLNPSVPIPDPVTGAMKLPSTATAYAWVIWSRDYDERHATRLRWIAPCRGKLERPGDYDVWPKVSAAELPEFQWGQP